MIPVREIDLPENNLSSVPPRRLRALNTICILGVLICIRSFSIRPNRIQGGSFRFW